LIVWLAADPATRTRVERWLAGDENGASILRDNPRRRLVRLDDTGTGPLLVKHFRTGSRHAHRETVKSWLGRSPAEREHRALCALHDANVPVPEPLGLGRLADGDRILVIRFHPGRSVEALLASPHAERRAGLRALGAAVGQLHRAGFVHGDLHRGNVLITDAGPLLVDLQHARRRRRRFQAERDLGDLDYSLWGHASAPDRIRVRAAALGIPAPRPAGAERSGPDCDALLDVGDAARNRAFDHGRSRTRRALRPGRRFAELRGADGRGMRVREFEAADAAIALERHREALAAADARVLVDDARSRVTRVDAGRPVIVKEVATRGAGRWLADLFRGTPARRAWRAGHGLLARGIGAALPLAFLETRVWGMPSRSAVILADLAPARDALETEAPPEEILEALTRLLVQLHLREVEHGDLKATHVFLARTPAGLVPQLIDFEGARFPYALSTERRIEALAELNASLPDRFSASLRRTAFDRYATSHPFEDDREEVLRSVIRLSLKRRHRWTGSDCPSAAGLAPPPAK